MGKEYQVNSDTILWNDFIKGDEDAFRLIYNNYVQPLFNFGCNYTHDKELVKDCIHDVFIELSKYRSKLGQTDNIKLYLFKSLKREIVRSLNKGKLLSTIDNENIPFNYPGLTDDKQTEDESEEQHQHLETALETLTSRQKEAIFLKLVSGLSYEELSVVMKLNYQSARNLVFRGLEKLRENYPKKLLLFFFPLHLLGFKNKL
jgi:RNA polymerase sigma factor (sigma-70 family)